MRRVVVILVAAGLAGCASGTAPPSSSSSPTAPPNLVGAATTDGAAYVNRTQPGIEIVVFHQAGTTGPSAEEKVTGSLNGVNTTLTFPVGKHAAGLLVELSWPDATNDLDLVVDQSGFCPNLGGVQCTVNAYFGNATGTGVWRNEAGAPGRGDSPARLRILASEALQGCDDPCAWNANAWAKASLATPFDLYASVFYGAPPPNGYTALPAR